MNFLQRVLEERWLLYIGLFGLAVGLPLSRSFISIAPAVLLGAWLFDGLYRKDLKAKWESFSSNRSAIALTAIFLIYFLSAVFAENQPKAIKLVIDKLPLVLLPLSLSGLSLRGSKGGSIFLRLHIAALFLSTLLSFINWHMGPQIGELRDSILFVNHIRLSLMMAIASGLVFLRPELLASRPFAFLLSGWFLFFAFYFQLATGFLLIGLVIALMIARGIRQRRFSWTLGIIALIAIGYVLTVSLSIVKKQFTKPRITEFNSFSKEGSRYYHLKDNLQTENGHYVWHDIVLEELISAWNERSEIKLKDDAGFDDPIIAPMIRYMTSKGLKKDSEGLQKLTEVDIQNIEAAKTSILQDEHEGIFKRIAVICYEIDAYRYGGNPSLSSLTVKLEYWKTGWKILKRNSFFGVGVGDLRDEFNAEFQKGTQLTEDAWDKTHNQYLTWMITFGFVAGLSVLIFFLIPLLRIRKEVKPSAVLIYGIFLISFLTEDTMENQLGLNLFLFYFILLLMPQEPKLSASR